MQSHLKKTEVSLLNVVVLVKVFFLSSETLNLDLVDLIQFSVLLYQQYRQSFCSVSLNLLAASCL